MRLDQLSLISRGIRKWLEGNYSTSDLARNLEMDTGELGDLLLENDLSDWQGHPEPETTEQDVINLLLLYFALKAKLYIDGKLSLLRGNN